MNIRHRPYAICHTLNFLRRASSVRRQQSLEERLKSGEKVRKVQVCHFSMKHNSVAPAAPDPDGGSSNMETWGQHLPSGPIPIRCPYLPLTMFSTSHLPLCYMSKPKRKKSSSCRLIHHTATSSLYTIGRILDGNRPLWIAKTDSFLPCIQAMLK